MRDRQKIIMDKGWDEIKFINDEQLTSALKGHVDIMPCMCNKYLNEKFYKDAIKHWHNDTWRNDILNKAKEKWQIWLSNVKKSNGGAITRGKKKNRFRKKSKRKGGAVLLSNEGAEVMNAVAGDIFYLGGIFFVCICIMGAMLTKNPPR